MKNNDNLKEKEIKQEKIMDKNELESVSGGVTWEYDAKHPYGSVCGWFFYFFPCHSLTPICISACSSSNITIAEKYEKGSSPDGWSYRPEIVSPEKCKDCSECAAQKACPGGGFWLLKT